MKKFYTIFFVSLFATLFSKSLGKQCYFCIGPADECGDTNKNQNSMTCDLEIHTCASYLIHIEEVDQNKAIIVRVCDELVDCGKLDTSQYGSGTCQCLREGCEGEMCNSVTYTEQDIIDKADIGNQCLLQSAKQGAQVVSLLGNNSDGFALKQVPEEGSADQANAGEGNINLLETRSSLVIFTYPIKNKGTLHTLPTTRGVPPLSGAKEKNNIKFNFLLCIISMMVCILNGNK